MKKALIYASVVSMIDLFNRNNIQILQNLGYEVEIACNFDSGSNTSKEKVENFRNELTNKGIRYHQVPVPRDIQSVTDIVKSVKITKQLAKDNGYDIVHCHSPIGAAICRWSFKNEETKVIYTAHGFHFYSGAPVINWAIFYPIEKYLSRYTDDLITINKEDYKRSLKFNAKNNIYIPGVGIDTDQIINRQVDILSKRIDLGVNENDFIILSVGELNKNKNHEIVIRALAQIKQENIHYIICGIGSLDHYLKELASELKLENKVHFLGFRKDIIDIMIASDLFVFPSFREGLPFSVMEAMASGMPIIASKIRGNSDLISAGKGGILISPNNVGSWSESITKIYENKNERDSMGAYNQRKIQNFDIKVVNAKMENIYFEAGRKKI